MTLAAAPDAALLERVSQRAGELDAFTRGAALTVTIASDELDADGASTKHAELVLRVTHEKGRAVRQLLSATEDGKDVSSAKRAELEDSRGSEREQAQPSPFHPSQRLQYAFSLLPPSDRAPGLVRIAFQPAGASSPALMRGDAAVDPETGDVVRMSMRPSKLPRLVDALSLELEFDARTSAGRALSRLTARGAAGLAFLRKRFVVVTTFSDYAGRE